MRVTLELRPQPQLPDPITRAQLIEQAHAVLRAAMLRRTAAVVTEITYDVAFDQVVAGLIPTLSEG